MSHWNNPKECSLWPSKRDNREIQLPFERAFVAIRPILGSLLTETGALHSKVALQRKSSISSPSASVISKVRKASQNISASLAQSHSITPHHVKVVCHLSRLDRICSELSPLFNASSHDRYMFRNCWCGALRAASMKSIISEGSGIDRLNISIPLYMGTYIALGFRN